MTVPVLRQAGGYCRLDEFGLMEIYGPEASRFLNAQTTNDVNQLEPFMHQESSLLDRKAHVEAYFDLYRRNKSFRIIAGSTQIKTILKRLEQFRFADKVEFLDLSHAGVFFTLQGPKCRRVIKLGLDVGLIPDLFKGDLIDLKLWGCSVHLFKKTLTGEDGYFLRVAKTDADPFFEKLKMSCQSLGLIELTNRELETARIEAGILEFGVDFGNESFLPETGLDYRVVSYTKGCFLGQEVLARVRSQGAPTRGLVGLLFPQGENLSFAPNTKMAIDNNEAVWIKSNTFSTSLNCTIALAYVKREYRTPGQSLVVEMNGQRYQVVVVLPPFIEMRTSNDVARQLYEQAIKMFASEDDLDPDSQSVGLLREALDLNPFFEDAYESLGVILSKRDRLDEAVSLMKKLAELNPDSIMAHTNLSVFYMQKGMKEEAEEEKAISMGIRMKLLAKQALIAKEEQDEKAQLKEKSQERMQMFKEVLEIDSEDLLANYGLGSCYVVLDEFSQAVPYLKKAIAIKPSHTVAYLALGEAYEGLNCVKDAIEAYQKGIEVAAKKGDMMPLQEMQKKLALLENVSKE